MSVYTYFKTANGNWRVVGPGLQLRGPFSFVKEYQAKETVECLNIAYAQGRMEKAKEIRQALNISENAVSKKCRNDEEQQFIIIVNGEYKLVGSVSVSYNEICGMAGYNPDHNPSITFCRSNDLKSEGIMAPKDLVKIKNGTIFNVAITNNA